MFPCNFPKQEKSVRAENMIVFSKLINQPFKLGNVSQFYYRVKNHKFSVNVDSKSKENCDHSGLPLPCVPGLDHIVFPAGTCVFMSIFVEFRIP